MRNNINDILANLKPGDEIVINKNIEERHTGGDRDGYCGSKTCAFADTDMFRYAGKRVKVESVHGTSVRLEGINWNWTPCMFRYPRKNDTKVVTKEY